VAWTDVSVDDLRKFWPQLPTGLDEQVDLLVKYAVAIIRKAKPNIGSDIDLGTFDPDLAQLIILEMVKTAMLAGENAGRSAWSEGDGPFVESATFSTEVATAQLDLTAKHRWLLSDRSAHWQFDGYPAY